MSVQALSLPNVRGVSVQGHYSRRGGRQTWISGPGGAVFALNDRRKVSVESSPDEDRGLCFKGLTSQSRGLAAALAIKYVIYGYAWLFDDDWWVVPLRPQ